MPTVLVTLLVAWSLPGQRPPEALYCYPPCGVAGTVVQAVLAGADWTPDTKIICDDPRLGIEALGAPGPVLVPEPPYWQGIRSYLNDPPLPREMPARLTIPADMPEGPVRWRAVNACGSKGAGTFWVGRGRLVAESPENARATDAGTLPVTVFGRLGRIEEIDRYRFIPPSTGMYEAEVFARRLGSDFNAVVQVRDSTGSVVAEQADTLGRDARVRFRAEGGKALELSIRDIDYKGYRSMAYRVALRPVTDSPGPTAGEVAGGSVLVAPSDSRGAIGPGAAECRFVLRCAKGEALRVEARVLGGAPADLYLRLAGPDGKVAFKADDHAGALDPVLTAVAAADGEHMLIVGDHSGLSMSGKVSFRLGITRPPPGFRLEVPAVLQVAPGGESPLEVKVARLGGFSGPVRIAASGLPPWLSLSGPMEIDAKSEVAKLKAAAAKDAPAAHAMVRFTGTADIGGRPVVVEGRAPPTGLGGAPWPESGPAFTLCCATLAPPFKARVVEADGGRRVHRGATHLPEISIQRLDRFAGEVVLDMAASQQRHRQGIRGGQVVVPPGASKVEYPVFLPEGLETSRTSRIGLVAMARIPDAAGVPRWVLAPVEGQVTMSIEGALMKLSAVEAEMIPSAGGTGVARLRITRAGELAEPVEITLAQGPPGASAPVVRVPPGKDSVEVPVTFGSVGGGALLFRAETRRRGQPVVSEAEIEIISPAGTAPREPEPKARQSGPGAVSPRP